MASHAVSHRLELGVVNWLHPAYANREILARNDKEILSASLEGLRFYYATASSEWSEPS
jgi:hypothetical protein